MNTQSESTFAANFFEVVPVEIGHSPLWMVTRRPHLNQFVQYLDAARAQLQNEPESPCTLRFSRTWLQEVRRDFSQMIREGEERLHQLSELISSRFLTSFQRQSVVIGEVASTRERFTLSQSLSEEDLYSTTDLDLGNRQLAKLLFFDGTGWSQAALVSNVVEYQPTEPNRYAIHKILSRIKAEEEIWNKVVDEIFGLDTLVKRDKKLEHLSRYVKDVFGIKVVVGAAQDVPRFHSALMRTIWSDDILERVGIEQTGECHEMKFIETKNYLGEDDRKRSGWEAMKSVVLWAGAVFEIQVQPLRNFLHEREHLTRESHAGFKAKREAVRNEVAAHLPLFRFYRDLLKWLFVEGGGDPPMHQSVSVVLES
jgi:hypothetical protein